MDFELELPALTRFKIERRRHIFLNLSHGHVAGGIED